MGFGYGEWAFCYHAHTVIVPSGNTSSSSSSPTTTPLGSPIPVSIPKDRNGFSCTKK